MLKSQVNHIMNDIHRTDSLVNSSCKSQVSSFAELKRNTLYIFKPSNFTIL